VIGLSIAVLFCLWIVPQMGLLIECAKHTKAQLAAVLDKVPPTDCFFGYGSIEVCGSDVSFASVMELRSATFFIASIQHAHDVIVTIPPT
jgi:hypothetical protein